MTVQEAQKVIEELKAQGNSEEEIAGSFYLLFKEDKINVEELEGLVNLLGYHLTEEFKSMDPEQQKTNGYEEIGEEQEHSQSEGEENKEQEQPEEKEETEDDKAMNLMGLKNNKKEDEGNVNEEDEEKKAMKLFGR